MKAINKLGNYLSDASFFSYLFWLQTYLARQEGTSTASIEWKVDLEPSGLVIDNATIRASSQTFQTGHIEWTVCGDDSCVQLNGGK